MFSSNTSQVSNDVKYIEDFCSVYLRTGTGSSQTVTTGVKENTGALVISKSRSAATDWAWYDTFRGATKELASNTTAAEITQSQGLTSFNTDGHTWGTLAKVNTSGATYVDFVLKPTPKFFDVVTYTGTGSAQNIAHNLGSVPGCIIVKRTDSTSDWFVFHRKNGVANQAVSGFQLNATNAAVENAASQQSATTFNTGFVLNSSFASPNVSGATYVAYLFAHNAGGFGDDGVQDVISCGSYVGNGLGSGNFVSLGWEPQFVLTKPASVSGSWEIRDVLRGMPTSPDDNATPSRYLRPDSSAAEGQTVPFGPNATGFTVTGSNTGINQSGATYIYIAIRRGPMKTPTSGTSVFAPSTSSAATGTAITVGFPVDMQISGWRAGVDTRNWSINDRLRGVSTTSTESRVSLTTSSTDAESTTFNNQTANWNNTGFAMPSWLGGVSSIFLNFRRAPGFFDVVCYTGTGSARTVAHNLGAVPELMIVKWRSGTIGGWPVYAASQGANKYADLSNYDITAFASNSAIWGADPTSSVFSVNTSNRTNGSGIPYIAYLFASCPGVSKVGSYTGTGTTLQINCGFTAGARFVLIKRTDSTGSWYVWDVARGISSGNDPYLLLNSTAAEVTSTDYIDAYSAGFEISSTAPPEINASGGSFIFLAIS